MLHILKRAYYRNPVRRNLTVLFISLFITTAVPSIFIISRLSTRTTLEEKQRAAFSALETAGQRLEQKIEGMSNVSTAILSDSSMHSILKKDMTGRNASDSTSVDNNLYTICSTSADALSAYVYDKDLYHYHSDSSGTKTMKYDSFQDYSWYDDLTDKNGGNLLLYTSDIYLREKKEDALSVIRTINHLDTLEPIGTLVLNMEASDIESCFAGNSDDESAYALFRREGDVLTIINRDSTLSRDAVLNAVAGYDGENGALLHPDVIVCTVSAGDLVLLSLTPVAVQGTTLQQYLQYVLLILLANIGIMLLGLFILSRSITSPLYRLADQMEHLAEKDFGTIDNHYEEPNEIGLLTRHYNQMAVEIESLIQKEIVIQKTKRNLELNLMQAQFKPHFLYNTIDTARSLCLQGHGEAASCSKPWAVIIRIF